MFIALTNLTTGRAVNVAIDHVVAVGQDLDGQTLVNVGGQAVPVVESAAEIIALIAAKRRPPYTTRDEIARDGNL